MDAHTIVERKNEIINKYGPWTAHNVHLQDDIYTIAPNIVGDEIRLKRITQCVYDLLGGNVENARILDLACLEGLFAIEFARHGANCVGIEGREANIEKGKFVKQVLSLDNLQFFQDDVRNLSSEKYGHFDAVLCLGILYHLDKPDVFAFIERLGEVCRKVALSTRELLYIQTWKSPTKAGLTPAAKVTNTVRQTQTRPNWRGSGRRWITSTTFTLVAPPSAMLCHMQALRPSINAIFQQSRTNRPIG